MIVQRIMLVVVRKFVRRFKNRYEIKVLILLKDKLQERDFNVFFSNEGSNSNANTRI